MHPESPKLLENWGGRLRFSMLLCVCISLFYHIVHYYVNEVYEINEVPVSERDMQVAENVDYAVKIHCLSTSIIKVVCAE